MNDLTDEQRARALDLTDEQRARALDLYRKYVQVRNGSPSSVDGRERLSNVSVRAWLAVEAHVLDSHTCPDVESDARVQAWLTIATHPFFADCYSVDDTLLNAVLAKLDADPKPDPRVGLLDGVCLREGVVLTRSDAALLLSIADAAERPEAGA